MWRRVGWWMPAFRRLFCPADVAFEVLLVPIYKITRSHIPKRHSNAEYLRVRLACVKKDTTSVAVLCLILSHELSKLGSNRAAWLGGLGLEPRPRDGQVFRILCLLRKNAQKPDSNNSSFIIHIRCAFRLCAKSLAINDVTSFNWIINQPVLWLP